MNATRYQSQNVLFLEKTFSHIRKYGTYVCVVHVKPVRLCAEWKREEIAFKMVAALSVYSKPVCNIRITALPRASPSSMEISSNLK